MFSYNLTNFQSPFSYIREGHYNTVQFKNNYLKKRSSNFKSTKALKKLYWLNKKYFLNIWGILFLLTVFLNLYFLQPIDWSKFYSIFSTSRGSFSGVKIFGPMFFVVNDLLLAKWAFSIYISKTRKLREKISALEWLKLLSITFFIRSITPFSIGSEPYVIFWLKKRGISLRQASAIVSSLTVSWFLAQGVITWPSFIVLQLNHNLVSPTNIDSKYSWLIIAGLIVDIVSTAFVFTISYSKWIHYFFGLVKLKFNQLFKLKNVVILSKAELRHKYLENKSFKKEFKRIFFNLTTIKVIFVFTIQNVLNYALYAWLAISILSGEQNFLDSFHIINISTTSNNFVPTPGSEGSIQFTIEKMNSLVTNNTGKTPPSTNVGTLKEVIFLWRWFQKYKPFLCSIVFLVFYFLSVKWKLFICKRKAKKHNLNRNISPELISWYTVSDSLALT